MRKVAAIVMRNPVKTLGALACLTFATVGTASADNISKTFEFGEGTTQPRSHVRTFPLPCATLGGVAAVVKFKREGPVGAANDIPIIIELREPDTAPDQEGPVVETKTVTAKTAEQTVILRSSGRNRGCSLPWRVRVKHANDGVSPSRVSGSIRLDFDGRLRDVVVQDGGISSKGNTKFINLGNPGNLRQGRIEITANWYHFLGTIYVPGPNPIKLKISLIDPSETVIKTVEAFSSDEARSGLTKFKLTHQITDCPAGQWKLFIHNPTNDDAKIKGIYAKFTPDCP